MSNFSPLRTLAGTQVNLHEATQFLSWRSVSKGNLHVRRKAYTDIETVAPQLYFTHENMIGT